MLLLEEILNSYKNGMSLERIFKKYGGLNIYIPKTSPYAKEKIVQEFNGGNYFQLAYKYNLSESSVRRVVREHKKKIKEGS